ncbi:MAG: hypothetical protein KDD04_09365, partial [Sinomicrobium sp.]|nr:hypothetical protein [Sinomicrobium sp.]
MKTLVPVRIATFIALLFIAGCEIEDLVEIQLEVVLDTPVTIGPDHLLLSGKIENQDWPFQIRQVGFIAYLSDSDDPNAIATQPINETSADSGLLPDNTFSGEISSLPLASSLLIRAFAEFQDAKGATKRFYSEPRFFSSGDILLNMNYELNDYQVTLNTRISGLEEDLIEEYGHCWIASAEKLLTLPD